MGTRPRHRPRRDPRKLTVNDPGSTTGPQPALPLQDFPRVHAVTNTATVRRKDFLQTAEGVMRALGARGAVHLRTSSTSGRRFHELASALADIQNSTGCWLIVNDRVDIAAAVGAKGIQLASHSLRVPEARAVAPDIPAGTSIHSVDEAVAAEEAGASWCVAGTVFETPTHPGGAEARITFVDEVSHAVSIPVIAIGGIQPEHIIPLRQAGAYGIATIRGVDWDRRMSMLDTDPSPDKTRLAGSPHRTSGEAIIRYISIYDWHSGSERDHHAHGKRRATGYSAE
jgi:thiazole tautomerase (transcriptional regulator TenI)